MIIALSYSIVNLKNFNLHSIRNNNSYFFNKTKPDMTQCLEERMFVFDKIFNTDITNEQIYVHSVRSLVNSVLEKAKATVFSYGHSGSGKTFTIMGEQNDKGLVPGLFLYSANDILVKIAQNNWTLKLWVSFFDIQGGKIFDLLNEKKVVFAREDGKQGVNIVGLVEKQVNSMEELMGIVSLGVRERGTNPETSRSHGIVQLTLKEPSNKIFSKMSFVDLAGSERSSEVLASTKQLRLEAIEIGKSLLGLRDCIKGLNQEKRHPPARGSKFLQILKDSFIGNCVSLVIANVAASPMYSEGTMATLEYVNGIKELQRPGEIVDCMTSSSCANTIEAQKTALKIEASRRATEKGPAPLVISRKPHFQKPVMDSFGRKFQDENQNFSPNIVGPPAISPSRPPFQQLTHTAMNSMTQLPPADPERQRRIMEREQLINLILAEHNEILMDHKCYVEQSAHFITQEMQLISESEQPRADFARYAATFDAILAHKMEVMTTIRQKLEIFKTHLKQEQELSQHCFTLQASAPLPRSCTENDHSMMMSE